MEIQIATYKNCKNTKFKVLINYFLASLKQIIIPKDLLINRVKIVFIRRPSS